MNESSPYLIRMEMKPAFTIVGELRRTSLQDNHTNGTVPRLMNDFLASRIHEVRHRLNAPEFYGILDFSEEGPNSGRFSWIAGVEVSILNDIPEGMVGKNYPTLLYAIVTHRGTSDLSKVFDYMYQTWLPQSEYEPAGPFSFQFHGQHYKGPFDPDSEVEVYFPVRPITSGIAIGTKKNDNGLRFGAVFVPVSDMPRAVKWYSQVLGIPINPGFDLHRNEKTIYDFQVDGVDLLLDNIGAVPVDNPNVLFYLKTQEIQQTLSALKQQGVDIVSIEDTSANSKSIVIRDPDGNKITFLEESLNTLPSKKSSSIVEKHIEPFVPRLLYDGAGIDILWDNHDDAVKWFVDNLGWTVQQQEQWKPDPRATEGRMTHMGWGTWLVSALSDRKLPHHYAERGTMDNNIRWCWKIGDLEMKHASLKASNIRVTDIYRGPGGFRYFDFWTTAEGIRLTAQEDPTVSSSVFEPSWTRIGVSNLKSSIAWYQKNMGMLSVEVNEKEGYAIMSLEVNHKPDNVSLWVLEQLLRGTHLEKVDAPVRPYGFVESRHDFFTYHQNLQSRGIDVSEIGGFMEKGLIAFHLYDPDGNRLNIMNF